MVVDFSPFFSICLKGIPTICVVVFILCGCSLQADNMPLLPALYLIPVYYWLVFRPEWLPIGSLLGIGFFYDGIMGRELGLSAALLLFSSFALSYGRLFLGHHGFYVMWALFCVYSCVCLGIYGLYGASFYPLAVSWISSIVLYPLLMWCLSYVHLRLQSYV